MSDSEAIIRMIEQGGVYYNISGMNPNDVFADALQQIVVPNGVDKDRMLKGLCEREGLMTTSIGYGIALPHPRTPLIADENDERIYVCFLDKAVNFNAMDGKPVFVLFMILTAGSQSHLKVLSRLSYLFQQESFRSTLKNRPDTKELIFAIQQHL
jgi:nitrogen PTS system EIIA component